MAVIGVSGKARSGKNVFGEYLAQELFKKTGKVYVLMSYAHELKCMAQREFDLSWEQLWGDDKEVVDIRYLRSNDLEKYVTTGPEEKDFWTGREIMQKFGEFYRSIDPDFWTKKLFSIIEEKEYENVIITDVRYPNEVDPILKKGGIHIRIERSTSIPFRIERSIADKIHGSTHSSETSLDHPYKVDFTVINQGTLEELKRIAVETVDIMLELKKLKKN